jgi:parallel beta-helix repeat protein
MEEMKQIATIILCAILIVSSGLTLSQMDENTEGKAIVKNGVMYITHAPIRINSNADFTPANGVSGGDGSAVNPWIIEKLSINGAGYRYGISISNITNYFVIKNCHFHHVYSEISGLFYWDSGIIISNSINGKIENNICDNNENGMWIYNSDSIQVQNNTIHNCTSSGVSMYGKNNKITNNTILNNNFELYYGSIYFIGSHNEIVGNQLINNSYGITVSESTDNIVVNNYITGGYSGISLHFSSNNIVENNTMENNGISINAIDNKRKTCLLLCQSY